MKVINGENGLSRWLRLVITRAATIVGFLFWAASGLAQSPPAGDGGPTNVPLASWSFQDTSNWTSDQGFAPISFTNLAFSHLGYNENSTWTLAVDTNVPAWLQYYVYEPNNAATNLTVDTGSVTFWFAPDWGSADTNALGSGPGDWGRLFEVGSYAPDSSYGWWSIFVDEGGTNLYFAAQTNDLSSNVTIYASVPISWTTNFFHFIVLTYCATNTALYLDDVLVTNGPPMTVFPGLNALTNGFWIGSSSNGLNQSRGMFDLVATYNYPLDSNDIDAMFNWYYPNYEINPYNIAYMDLNLLTQNFSAYGTNLALSPVSISNNLASLFVINSTGDVLYEIQGTTNLAQPNWFSLGFVYGSELTNLTLASVMISNQPTLFLRIRSWIDDGSGLPIWWQLQYFGYTGVDPNGDPAGDGYSNIQKFQNGMNPNVFYTPPAPQGVTVNYNSFNGNVGINWQTSPGPVTGYTVQRYDSFARATQTFNVGQGVTSQSDNVSSAMPDPFDGGRLDISYTVQAQYAGGNSSWSASMPLEPSTLSSAGFISGPLGSAYAATSPLPSGTSSLLVTIIDQAAWQNYFFGGSKPTNHTFQIQVTDPTQGLYLVPTTNTTVPPASDNGNYFWSMQTLQTNGNLGAPYQVLIGTNAVPPYSDGRAQLKQNLIFLLRAATVDSPFDYIGATTNNANYYFLSNPPNYAYAGFYQLDGLDVAYEPYQGSFDPYWPFENNYRYRNFVMASTNLDANGRATTGAGGNYAANYVPPNSYYPGGLMLLEPPLFQFQAPATNGASIPALLATNNSRWLASYALDSASTYLWKIGATNYGSAYGLFNNVRNWFGLPFLSANISGTTILYAGNTTPSGGYFYPETAQPQFQTAEYDFWQGSSGTYGYSGSPLPGMTNFSTSQPSGLLLAGVGNFTTFNGYAKLSVQNGYSGVYAYLGQYFDRAYQIGTNGVATTNSAGTLSPYGNFSPTIPGSAALVTMPDLDTGQRGTAAVYCVSLALDANHDGTMNTNLVGPDTTSQANPYVFWANNNYDRWHSVDGGDTEQDDLLAGETGTYNLDPNDPDCNYIVGGKRMIPCARDLEDFARFWICGVTSNLLAAMPAGSTITLNWGDVGYPDWNGNNPTIDIFQAADTDGGIGYLTNSTIATQQTNINQCSYIGRLGPGGSLQLNASQFNGWAGNHFIWCGVSNGIGGLNLTISDANSNVLAQSTAYIQIMDIKQMYERWTVGDDPASSNNPAPLSVAIKATDGLSNGVTAFQYLPPQNTNTPYILFVHGWNMKPWEKDRFAETAFKRLYWQGYQGRFGEFRWPTFAGFPFGEFSAQAFDLRNYDNSESNAWASGMGLLNKLNDLNAEYPGQVYLMAHSLGNPVAGEALRLAGTNQVVNTYIAMQGAISAHTYDTNTAARSFSPSTPDNYANYWTNNAPCYFSSSAGAGTYVNFFNTNDYALHSATYSWEYDQNHKPDISIVGYPGYHYSVSSLHPNGYYVQYGSASNAFYNLNFPTNTYPIFAYCDQSWSYALGAQANVNGSFAGNQVDLTAGPYNFANTHKYHSGEFRSDDAQRWQFWTEVLIKMKLKQPQP